MKIDVDGNGILKFNSINIIRVHSILSPLEKVIVYDFYTKKTAEYDNAEDLVKIGEGDIILIRPFSTPVPFLMIVYKPGRIDKDEAIEIIPQKISDGGEELEWL